MMAFDTKSRYAKQPLQPVRDQRGRTVNVVVPPDAPVQELLGYHVRRQAERLDHLAARYLDNPHGYWRICEFNDVMNAEMLSEAAEFGIPAK
jgi:hypothetical protein